MFPGPDFNPTANIRAGGQTVTLEADGGFWRTDSFLIREGDSSLRSLEPAERALLLSRETEDGFFDQTSKKVDYSVSTTPWEKNIMDDKERRLLHLDRFYIQEKGGPPKQMVDIRNIFESYNWTDKMQEMLKTECRFGLRCKADTEEHFETYSHPPGNSRLDSLMKLYNPRGEITHGLAL